MNEDVKKYISDYINDFLDLLGVKANFNVDYDSTQNVYRVDISGNNLSFLIGHRGDCLDSFQFLLNVSLLKNYEDNVYTVVDINGYKEKRKEKLEEIVKTYIDKVRFFQKEVPLPPMNSYERRYVHEFVNSYDDVETFSVGEGYERHIVIKLSE